MNHWNHIHLLLEEASAHLDRPDQDRCRPDQICLRGVVVKVENAFVVEVENA